MGAEAIKTITGAGPEKLADELRTDEELQGESAHMAPEVESFRLSNDLRDDPDVIPVIPPDLRPMVQLDLAAVCRV